MVYIDIERATSSFTNLMQNPKMNTLFMHRNNYYSKHTKYYTYLNISIIQNMLYICNVIISNDNRSKENIFIHSIKLDIMKALILQHQTFFKTATMLFSAYTVVLIILVAIF